MSPEVPTILSQARCVPAIEGVAPLAKKEYEQFLDQVAGWQVLQSSRLEKEFEFADFKKAMIFVNKVAEVAEAEGHHPDINVHGWNKVKLTLSTHAIGGLFWNDFILGAKINNILI